MPCGPRQVVLLLAVTAASFVTYCHGQVCPTVCTADQYCGNTTSGMFSCQECNAACVGCFSSGVEKCKSCASNYYNSSGSICKGCNVACAGCTDFGPDKCIKCAPGFFSSGGICRGCPVNTFGENCTGTCHCLDKTECKRADGFCSDWTCEWGWSNPPYCQTQCTPQQFGKNCAFDCHCPENDTCSQINGLCSSLNCHPFYGGPGCQILLPKLRLHPVVTNNECGNITVSWNQWVKDEDIGEGPVGQYILEIYKINVTDTWQEVIKRDDSMERYSYDFTSLDQDGTYLFRVNVKRMVDDKLSSEFTVGNPTEEVTTPCIVPTTTTLVPVTAAPTPPPGSLFQKFELKGKGTNIITVSWEKKDYGEILGNATLTYVEIGYGECSDPFPNSLPASIDVPGTGNFNLSLIPYRKYRISLTLDTLSHNASDSDKTINGTITTGVTAPTGPVHTIRMLDVKQSSARFEFTPPTCPERGGNFVAYLYSVQQSQTQAYVVENSTNISTVDVTGLTPFTRYILNVQYANVFGPGPVANVSFTTTEGVPGPTVISSIIPDHTSIFVSYLEPSVTNGIISEYEIEISQTSDFQDYSRKATNWRNVTFDALQPFTTYYVRVRARTSQGTFGVFSAVNETKTKEDFPSAPTRVSIEAVNETCLSVSWSAPANVSGVIIEYTIRYSRVDSSSAKSDIVIPSPTQLKSSICGLEPWTRYVIEVFARTSKGRGPPSSSVFQTTLHTVPPTPPAPTFLNNTQTTITIEIYPVKLKTGPVSQYIIYVNNVGAVERRRRQVGCTPPGTPVASFSDADIVTKTAFVVGDGGTYGSYNNPALDQKRKYDIYNVVVSTVGSNTKCSYSKLSTSVHVDVYVPPTTKSPSTVTASSNNTPLIVLLVVFILIIIIVIIVVCIIFWYRRRGQFKPPPYEPQLNDLKPTPFMIDDYDPHAFWNTVYSTRESRYIIAGRELIPDDGFNPDDNKPTKPLTPPITFQNEFHELPHEPQTTWNEASKGKNMRKNRFRHLLPYDHTRVILEPDENSDCDYINANFIKGYNKPHAYIAAQSPFDEETVLDFWRMIYQYNINVIVMITNVVEDKIVKCTQYWPDPEEDKVQYGAFILKSIEFKEFANYVIRTINIKVRNDRGKPKVVHIFDFCTWPDHGVPDDTIPLLEFRHKVREYKGTHSSPLLVHCGTGVSRTGAYIAIDSLIEQYENEGIISVFSFVRRMRKDRVAMVRTAKQYIFIYEAIFEARVAGDTRAGFDLKQKYHTLTMRNRKTKHSYLKDQFVSLQRYTRKVHPSGCSDARSHANFHKNRFPDVIPPNKYRPLLTTPGGLDRTDYINAVYLDSHFEHDHFVLTQTPLHTTIIDFWKLVNDLDVNTIVMMEDFKHEDDTCAEYWPENKIKKFEPFFVDNTNLWQQENVTIRHFKIHNMLHPKETAREVRQFQFNAWNDTEFIPKSKSMFLDLIDLVRSWQEQSNGDTSPILVHCKDGATHSGLFCAVWTICEAMKEDNDVDVYHTIKHMKRRRNQIVDTLDQYRFCYKTLWDCMNLRMPGGTLTNYMNHTSQDRLYNVGSLSLASYASHLDYV